MATLSNRLVIETEDEEEVAKRAALSVLSWHPKTWSDLLKRLVIILAGILIAALALSYLIKWFDKDFDKRLKAQQNQKTQALSQLANSESERQLIEKHMPLLKQLESQGIFGEEKRLEWVELLRTLEKHWPGVKLQYAIAAQILQPPPEGTPQTQTSTLGLLPNGEKAKNFGTFNTEMKLTLKLLHEGDTLAIIEELKNANLGKFSIKSCTFNRPASNTSVSTPIDAECILTWISMRPYTQV
jgi:hypothetical protein